MLKARGRAGELRNSPEAHSFFVALRANTCHSQCAKGWRQGGRAKRNSFGIPGLYCLQSNDTLKAKGRMVGWRKIFLVWDGRAKGLRRCLKS